MERYRPLQTDEGLKRRERNGKINRLESYCKKKMRVEMKGGEIYQGEFLDSISGGKFIEMYIEDGFQSSTVPIGKKSALRKENIDRYTPL